MDIGVRGRLVVGVCAVLAVATPLGAHTFGPDVPLQADARYDSHARVAADGAGRLVAVWAAGGVFGYDLDLLVARSDDAGAHWTPSAVLNADAATDGEYASDRFPEIATDGQTWLVVWSGEFSGIRCARSTDGGVTWSAPLTIHDPEIHAFVHVATDGHGTWVVAWDANGFGGITASRSTDGGLTWSAPFALAPYAPQTYASRPRIAADGTGAWVATWSSYAHLGGGQFTDRDLVMVRSTDGGASWSAPVPLNVTAATDSGMDTAVHLIAAPNGTWLASWVSTESFGGPATGYRVFVARSTDRGLTWSFPQPIESRTVGGISHETEPKLACDGRGTCLIAMQGASLKVYTSASLDDGVTWSDPLLVSAWTGWNPSAATDRAGTWIVTWNAPRASTGDDDIHMVRGAICGDAARGPGEDCEREGGAHPACCSAATCRFDVVDTPCAGDGDACTDDRCDGAGTCVHPPNVAPCDDGDGCTTMDRCVDGACVGGASLVCGSPCETCAEGRCTVPREAGCDADAPGGSTVALRTGTRAGRSELAWRWRSSTPFATADVVAAAAEDPLTLCIADEGPDGPTLRFAATIPGGACGRAACWRATADGRRYRNAAGTPDGVTSVRVRAGAGGDGRIEVKARGEHFAGPTLPLQPSVVVRLRRAATGRCWEARFGAPIRNDAARFQSDSR